MKTKPTSQSQSESHTPKETNSKNKSDDPRCTVCGGVGHNSKFCRYKGRGTSTESIAKHRVAALVGVVKHSDEDTDEDTCTIPEDSDVEAVLTQVSATMHALVSQTEGSDQPILGPTITAEVVVEGVSVNALLDTGSPVSIVSLEFIVNALAKQRTQNHTPPVWRVSVKN